MQIFFSIWKRQGSLTFLVRFYLLSSFLENSSHSRKISTEKRSDDKLSQRFGFIQLQKQTLADLITWVLRSSTSSSIFQIRPTKPQFREISPELPNRDGDSSLLRLEHSIHRGTMLISLHKSPVRVLNKTSGDVMSRRWYSWTGFCNNKCNVVLDGGCVIWCHSALSESFCVLIAELEWVTEGGQCLSWTSQMYCLHANLLW